MTEKDLELIKKAHLMDWEDIDETLGSCPEAVKNLHDIAIRKYRLDEVRAGII